MVYSVPASGGTETLESAAWDEGRIFFDVEVPVDSTGNGLVVVDSIPGVGCYRDCWYVTDHLGNVRSVVDISSSLASPQVVERNDYLPYGTRLSVGNTVLAANRYRLGGKEEQSFGGLDLGKVDFGARQYDPFTAGWTTIDPMAEKYVSLSPYSYCAGDPVNIVDPQGDTLFVKHRKETLMYLNGLFYYSDGKEYTGRVGGFLKRVDNAISSICQTDTGRAIIEELETSKNVFTIDYAESNSFVPDRAIDAGANLPVVMSMRGVLLQTDRAVR